MEFNTTTISHPIAPPQKKNTRQTNKHKRGGTLQLDCTARQLDCVWLH